MDLEVLEAGVPEGSLLNFSVAGGVKKQACVPFQGALQFPNVTSAGAEGMDLQVELLVCLGRGSQKLEEGKADAEYDVPLKRGDGTTAPLKIRVRQTGQAADGSVPSKGRPNSAHRHRQVRAENDYLNVSGLGRFIDDLLQKATTEKPDDLYAHIYKHLDAHADRLKIKTVPKEEEKEEEPLLVGPFPDNVWDYEDQAPLESDSGEEDERGTVVKREKKAGSKEVAVAGIDPVGQDMSWMPANHVLVVTDKPRPEPDPDNGNESGLMPISPTTPKPDGVSSRRNSRGGLLSSTTSSRKSSGSFQSLPGGVLQPGQDVSPTSGRKSFGGSPMQEGVPDGGPAAVKEDDLAEGPFPAFEWDNIPDKAKKNKRKEEPTSPDSARRTSEPKNVEVQPVGLDSDLSYAPANHILEVREKNLADTIPPQANGG